MDELPSPTPRELEILKVLWEHGPLPVSGVHKHLRAGDEKPQALNTVQTLIRIMATKGLVTYREEGRSFVYQPVYSREETASRFLDRVFDGAASQLVLTLLKAERIPPEELEQMRQFINAARKKGN